MLEPNQLCIKKINNKNLYEFTAHLKKRVKCKATLKHLLCYGESLLNQVQISHITITYRTSLNKKKGGDVRGCSKCN
jgi:hypothetical protein